MAQLMRADPAGNDRYVPILTDFIGCSTARSMYTPNAARCTIMLLNARNLTRGYLAHISPGNAKSVRCILVLQAMAKKLRAHGAENANLEFLIAGSAGGSQQDAAAFVLVLNAELTRLDVHGLLDYRADPSGGLLQVGIRPPAAHAQPARAVYYEAGTGLHQCWGHEMHREMRHQGRRAPTEQDRSGSVKVQTLREFVGKKYPAAD